MERAAVLDLDEGPRPLDRRAVVGRPVDAPRPSTASTPESVGSAASSGACGPSSGASAAPSSLREERLELGEERVLVLVADEPGAGIDAPRRPPGPPATEQPVTTTCASGFARRARRTAVRDFSSAVAVTVQVLTR